MVHVGGRSGSGDGPLGQAEKVDDCSGDAGMQKRTGIVGAAPMRGLGPFSGVPGPPGRALRETAHMCGHKVKHACESTQAAKNRNSLANCGSPGHAMFVIGWRYIGHNVS